MSESSFLYYAYGSNMFSAWLEKRCPSASALGVASLSGYELAWHKRSNDGSGKCDIAISDAPNSVVYGVLYQIACSEKHELDAAEAGYKHSMIVISYRSELISATTYMASETRIDRSLRPYTWYRALVVAGAKQHKLPEEYIRELEATTANEDNSGRHREVMTLIGQDIRP